MEGCGLKKAEKTELTREKILRAAMEEFGTNGYASSSLNNICGAGISKGLLYHNFAGKDALYLACVERCFLELTAYLREQETGADFHRYLEARLCYFRKNPLCGRIFFEALLQPPETLRTQINVLRVEFDTLNQQLFREILKTVSLQQGVTEQDAMEYFLLMQNLFNGYFSSSIFHGMPLADAMTAHEEKLTNFFSFLLYGIAERRAEA